MRDVGWRCPKCDQLTYASMADMDQAIAMHQRGCLANFVVTPAVVSRRDHFAAAAMQGLLSALPERCDYPERIASDAAEMADMLIVELDKPRDDP